jgi:hypothetical protein
VETLNKSAENYFPFIKYFLEAIFQSYAEINKQLDVNSGNKINKRQRIANIIANSIVPVSKAEICGILPDVSPTTVEAVLAEMVREGSVKKTGAARSTRYVGLI